MGRRAGVRRLWGFERAAARAGDALVGVVGVGSTVAAVMDWTSRPPGRPASMVAIRVPL
jgi:hypothetical protein